MYQLVSQTALPGAAFLLLVINALETCCTVVFRHLITAPTLGTTQSTARATMMVNQLIPDTALLP